jgi:hypothetical protein
MSDYKRMQELAGIKPLEEWYPSNTVLRKVKEYNDYPSLIDNTILKIEQGKINGDKAYEILNKKFQEVVQSVLEAGYYEGSGDNEFLQKYSNPELKAAEE